MIKLTVQDLFNIQNDLTKLYQSEMPFSLSYKVTRLIKIIEPEYKLALDSYKKIIAKYSSKDESGNILFNSNKDKIIIDPVNVDAYNKESSDLFDTEIEIACEKLPEQVTEYIIAAPSTIDSLTKIVDMKN